MAWKFNPYLIHPGSFLAQAQHLKHISALTSNICPLSSSRYQQVAQTSCSPSGCISPWRIPKVFSGQMGYDVLWVCARLSTGRLPGLIRYFQQLPPAPQHRIKLTIMTQQKSPSLMLCYNTTYVYELPYYQTWCVLWIANDWYRTPKKPHLASVEAGRSYQVYPVVNSGV